ncbi:hypothetical protein BJP40_08165 [Streptomyces sp. CC53]|uniref:hypothetical protein n=1 Tax=Streptomyces sp. CC53 TaxID=1906740 RepID=UPI0008DD5669|nr:hypothetical protein [Streptomyces sp. CC53]OII60831.1 hypothetical protein BJP40_08165 [Streptomyces sp. CC53]
MNLRMTGLGAAVAVATLLPFVATAVPAAGPERAALTAGGGLDPGIRPTAPLSVPLPTPGSGSQPGPGAGRAEAPGGRAADGSGTVAGASGAVSAPPSSAPRPGSSPEAPVLAESDGRQDVRPPGSAGGPQGRAARCGPPLVSPGGVEAQTCVLTEGAETWGRTYYRNTSGEALRAVLSLMGPAGRTVRTHCAISRGDEPGACETPREKGRGPIEEYTAVAEFAADGDPESPLLLRAASNPAPTAGS